MNEYKVSASRSKREVQLATQHRHLAFVLLEHLVDALGVVDGGGHVVGLAAGLVQDGARQDLLPDGFGAQQRVLLHEQFLPASGGLLALDVLAGVGLIVLGHHVEFLLDVLVVVVFVVVLVVVLVGIEAAGGLVESLQDVLVLADNDVGVVAELIDFILLHYFLALLQQPLDNLFQVILLQCFPADGLQLQQHIESAVDVALDLVVVHIDELEEDGEDVRLVLLEVDDGLLLDGQVHDEPHQVLDGRVLQLVALVAEDLEDHRDDAERNHGQLRLLDVGEALQDPEHVLPVHHILVRRPHDPDQVLSQLLRPRQVLVAQVVRRYVVHQPQVELPHLLPALEQQLLLQVVVRRLHRAHIVALVEHNHFSPQYGVLVEIQPVLQSLQHQAYLLFVFLLVGAVEQHRYLVDVDGAEVLLGLLRSLRLPLRYLALHDVGRSHRHILREVGVLFEYGNVG